jgi:hypothetical protein
VLFLLPASICSFVGPETVYPAAHGLQRSETRKFAPAILFDTPLAELLVGNMPPLLLEDLLYLGSGLGLSALLVMRRLTNPAVAKDMRIASKEIPWLRRHLVRRSSRAGDTHVLAPR